MENLYFMIARQRSGTGAISSICNQHPAIQCTEEVFRYCGPNYDYNYWNFLDNNYKKYGITYICSNIEIVIDKYFQYCKNVTKKNKLFFDIKYDQLYSFHGVWESLICPRILNFAYHNKIKIINIIRRNFLKLYVSWNLAKINNTFHSESIDELIHKSIFVDLNAFQICIMNWEKENIIINEMLSIMPHVLQLKYDELLLNNKLTSSAAKALNQFFGVSGLEQYATPYVKQVPSIRDAIKNLDEVQDFLCRIGHEEWLEQDKGPIPV